MKNEHIKRKKSSGFFNSKLHHLKAKDRIFTLLELLIVIAIIMILASVLLPSLSRARSVTQRIACANTFKQISTATQMYVQDYNDWLPSGAMNWSSGPAVYWYNHVGNYLNWPKTHFKCPSETVGFGAYADGLFYYTHYGINSRLAGDYDPLRKSSSVTGPSLAVNYTDNIRKNNFMTIYNSHVSFRHLARTANFAYLDGHVSSRKNNEVSFKEGFE